MRGGYSHVLVVDDEPSLRRLMAEVLRMEGFRVLTAAHAAEALEISAGPAGRPALLVTDIMMPPHCDGIELASLLRLAQPGLKVIYVSAYAGDPRIAEACRDPDGVFLPKPVSSLVLAQRAREILRADPENAYAPGRGPRGTVLLRIGDPHRRQWMRDALAASGFWVLDSAHGSEALFIGRWHEGPLHLVLTDPPRPDEGPFWAASLSEYREGYDTLFVEEAEGGGIALRPLREPEIIPELWRDVRRALAGAMPERPESLGSAGAAYGAARS